MSDGTYSISNVVLQNFGNGAQSPLNFKRYLRIKSHQPSAVMFTRRATVSPLNPSFERKFINFSALFFPKKNQGGIAPRPRHTSVDIAGVEWSQLWRSGQRRSDGGHIVGTCESFFCVRIESRIESAVRFNFESNFRIESAVYTTQAVTP